MAWDEIKVLDEPANNTTLLIKEALHIHLTDKETLLNRDEGVAISDCWSPILSHECGIRLHPPEMTSDGEGKLKDDAEAGSGAEPKIDSDAKAGG